MAYRVPPSEISRGEIRRLSKEETVWRLAALAFATVEIVILALLV